MWSKDYSLLVELFLSLLYAVLIRMVAPRVIKSSLQVCISVEGCIALHITPALESSLWGVRIKKRLKQVQLCCTFFQVSVTQRVSLVSCTNWGANTGVICSCMQSSFGQYWDQGVWTFVTSPTLWKEAWKAPLSAGVRLYLIAFFEVDYLQKMQLYCAGYWVRQCV